MWLQESASVPGTAFDIGLVVLIYRPSLLSRVGVEGDFKVQFVDVNSNLPLCTSVSVRKGGLLVDGATVFAQSTEAEPFGKIADC